MMHLQSIAAKDAPLCTLYSLDANTLQHSATHCNTMQQNDAPLKHRPHELDFI